MIRTGIFTGRQSPPHFRVSLDKDDATRTVACKSIETLVETFCEYITRAIRNTWRRGKWQNTFASCCSFYSISERNSTLKWVPCWMEQKRGKVRKKGREKRSIHYLKSRSFRRNVRKMQRALEGKSVSRGWNVKGSVTYIIMPRECDFRVHSKRRRGRSINIPKRNSDREFSEMSSVRTKEHALDLVAQVSSIYVYEFLRFPWNCVRRIYQVPPPSRETIVESFTIDMRRYNHNVSFSSINL